MRSSPSSRTWLWLPMLTVIWAGVLKAASSEQIDLLAFGDWSYGKSTSNQRDVAEQMERYSRKQGEQFEAALLLGDNFYREMPGGVKDKRWQNDFEEMYDPEIFQMPFYGALGNHDYEKDKVKMQFRYARENPHSRWKLPAKWYTIDFPSNQPLVTVFVLDSNWSKLTEKERAAQNQWLDRELADRSNGPWTVAVAHHPLFSNGNHGDSERLTESWGRRFKKHQLDFYLSGHDHTLQHLEVKEWPVSFLISGGGGAKLQPLRRDDRGPFSRSLHGFAHLQFTREKALVRYVTVDGEVAHEFTRSAEGKVKVLHSTGRDKPKPKKKKDKDDEDDDD